MMKFLNKFVALVLIQTSIAFASPDDSSFGMDPQGNSWSIFTESSASPYPVIQVVYKPYSGSFGSPIVLSDTEKNSFTPQISVNVYGDAAAVWTSEDQTTFIRSLYVSTLQNGQSWSTPTRITDATESVASNYQINILENGNFVVGWSSYLDPYGNIYSLISGNINGSFEEVTRYISETP